MHRWPQSSAALVVASVALVVATGGTTYAAKLISGADVKNGSLSGADIRDRSLDGRDIQDGTLTSRF